MTLDIPPSWDGGHTLNWYPQATLRFGGTGAEASTSKVQAKGLDVNGMGDLVCRFNIEQAGFQAGGGAARRHPTVQGCERRAVRRAPGPKPVAVAAARCAST